MCVGVSSTGQGSEVSVYTSGDRNKFSVASVKNVDVDEKNNRNVSAEGCSFGILFLFLSLSVEQTQAVCFILERTEKVDVC